MSDSSFDALRASGEYPPKGWGWKDTVDQRSLLVKHFAKPHCQIDPWMIGEASRLGIAVPTETTPTLIAIPKDLHPATQQLVKEFAEAMALKLRTAEQKYGYSDGWKTEEWELDCRRDLYRHAEKGDPRDVAIYAAFAWARGWSTRTGGLLKIVWR